MERRHDTDRARRCRQRALAERVEESLSFESLAQVLELERGCPEPGWLNEVGNELHCAGAWIDREPAMNDDLVAESQRVMLAERLPAKQDALQAPVVVTQAEVDVPADERLTSLTSPSSQRSAERVRFERLAEEADECLRPGEAWRSSAIAPTNPKAHQREPYSTGCPLPTRSPRRRLPGPRRSRS